jgi:predicted regulator of Ras-like GTPase activity (Roadblock/LC7/MglB family)
MPNRVYLTVCDALSNIVSRRAAENIVADALRTAGTNADKVSAHEMQILLRSTVFARLQQIIPVAQAKGEIRVILSKLESGFVESRASSLSPEVLEGLEAIKAEFRMFANSANPRVLRLADGMGSLSSAADPIAALNLLWAELDLLQAEESGLPLKGASLQKADSIAPGASGVFFPDDQHSNPEFVLDLETDFSEADLIKSQTVKSQTPTLTENLWIKDASQFDQNLNPEQVVLEEPEEIVAGLKLDSFAGLSAESSPIVQSAESSPPVQQVAPIKAARFRAQTRLAMTPEEQENLLSRFASQEGVIGVALCSRFGQVIMARLHEGSASHLSSVVAATVMVLEKSKVARLFYAQFETTSAFIAPFGDGILTVLANSSVNVGRVLSEVNALDQIMLQST